MSAPRAEVTITGGLAGPLSETRVLAEPGTLSVWVRQWTDEPWQRVKLRARAGGQLVGSGVDIRLLVQLADGGTLTIPLGFDGETIREVLSAPRQPAARQPAPRGTRAAAEPTTEPELPAVGATNATTHRAHPSAPDHLHGRPLDAARESLEKRAIAALESGRYDLAREQFLRLSKASGVNQRLWVTLAEVAGALGRGDAQAAYFKIRDDVNETVTPVAVLSKLAGNTLYAQGKLALAAGAFCSAALATASDQQAPLKARADQIAEEAGLDEDGLDVALIAASIEHYSGILRRNPEDQTAVRVLKEAEAWRQRVLGAASEAMEPVTRQAERLDLADQRRTGGIGKQIVKYLIYSALIVLAMRACL